MTAGAELSGGDLRRAVEPSRLVPWMSHHLEGWDESDVDLALASGGRSNLTCFISQGDRSCVLRRPPLGHVLPSAHDMRREVRVITALEGTDIPVPHVLGLCEDESIIGCTFYIMERVEGRTLSDASDTATLTSADAACLSRRFVEILAGIHALDYRALGLEDFGRPDGYVERQIRRWQQQWERSQTRELPEMDELIGALHRHRPVSSHNSLVHGDYRLDNLIIERAPGVEPLAVVDWEMSTLGDPLADLGLMLVYWADPGDSHAPSSVATHALGNSGFMTRAGITDLYAHLTGFDVGQLPFYMGLGYFKLAVILEGIHKRFLMGRTLGEGFDTLGVEVPALVDAGRHALAGSPG